MVRYLMYCLTYHEEPQKIELSSKALGVNGHYWHESSDPAFLDFKYTGNA